MGSMAETAKKRMGRPPAGLGKHGEPEKIADYPRLSLTVRPSLKVKLEAVATIQKRPTWKVVDDALAAYFDSLPVEDRKLIEALAKRVT
jgi:hypothetical protein